MFLKSRYYLTFKMNSFILQQQKFMFYNDKKKSYLSHSRSTKLETFSKTFNTSMRSSINQTNPYNVIKNNLTSINKNKQMIECTFEPQTREKKHEKRSIDKFLKDQEMFVEKKELRIQQLRNQINKAEDQQLTGVPGIFDARKQTNVNNTNKMGKTNIFERLSKQKKVNRSLSALDQCLFSPKILNRSKSIVRREDVSTLLYEDAKKRQQKDHILAQSQRKQRNMMMSPTINSNTNALVLKKIMNQFNDLISDEEINPLIGLSVLEQIFNVDLNPNKNQSNNQMVKHLIQYLNHQNGSCMITSQKLRQFVAIIINGTTQNSMFTFEQQKEIYQKFHFFYKERVTRERKIATPQKLTFRPKTLNSSTKMATYFRQKTFQQIQNFIQNQKTNLLRDGDYKLEDIYHIDHLKKLSDKQKKRVQLQNQQLQQCTFKPNLTDSKKSLDMIKKKPKVTLKTSKRQIQRTQYTGYRQQNQNQILNVTKIMPFRSKEQKERKRRQKQSQLYNLADNVGGAQKAILRMSIGRQRREVSQSYLERGYPKCENWVQHQKQIQKKEQENIMKLSGIGIR